MALNNGTGTVAIGYSVGTNLTSGNYNILMGYDIDAPSPSSNNTLNIGNLLFGTGLDGIGTTLSSGNIGIGTTSPIAKLSVAGDIYATGTITTTNALSLYSTSTNATSTNFFSTLLSSTWGSITNAIFGNSTTTNATSTNLSTQNLMVTGASTSTFANGIQLSVGCFRNPAGTCVGGGKESTYIVAAQNSTNKAYADYIASSTSAETQINQALQAAYAGGRGGKVYLMEGDYILSTGAGDKIVMATSTSLIGAGASTVIHIASSTNATANAIAANSTPYITIANLFVDGNKGRNSGSQNGISFTSVSSSTIRNVIVATTTQYGILLNSSSNNTLTGNSANSNSWFGIFFSSSTNNTLLGNTANSNLYSGIYFITSSNNTFLGNTTNSNYQYGISFSSSNNNTLLGNTANSNLYSGIYIVDSYANTLTGNIANSNVSNGIILSVSSSSTLSGNIVNNNAFGIYLASGSGYNTVVSNSVNGNTFHGITLDSNSNNNTVTANTASGNGRHGVYITTASNNNVVSSNRIADNGASNAYSGINIVTSIGNLISGNNITDTAGTSYAISIDSGSTGTTLVGNIYSGVGASSISDLAPDTKYTQWDRLTLDTKQLGQVSYSPLSIFASSSVALASTTQMGTGKLMSLNNSLGEMFTIANNGNVGIGTTSPYAKLSVTGTAGSAPLFAFASSTGSNLLTLGASGVLTFGSTTAANIFLNGGATTSSVANSNSIAIGNQALSYVSPSATNLNNTAIGYQALYGSSTAPMTGTHNFAAGYQAGYSNTTGSFNSFIGYQAGVSNTTGSYNSFTGDSAGYFNSTGSYNSFTGRQTGLFNTTGSSNNAFGPWALYYNTTGSYNTGLGNQALYNNTTGYDNVMLGHIANAGGNNITTGYNNIALGYNAGIGTSTNSTNFLNIGNSFFGSMIATTTSTSLPTTFANAAFAIATSSLLGNTTFAVQNSSAGNTVANFFSNAGASLLNIQNSGNVGIGTTSPYAKLSVVGEIVGAFFTGTTTATSTFGGNLAINGTGTTTSNGGFNIASGCFAINGVCVGGGAAATAVGGTGAIQFANGTAFNGDNTQLTYLGGNLGIGTTTPYAKLSVVGNIYTPNNITAASSTLGYASSTALTVSGDTVIGGTLKVTGATTLSSTAVVSGNFTASALSAFGSGVLSSNITIESTRVPTTISGTEVNLDSFLTLNPTANSSAFYTGSQSFVDTKSGNVRDFTGDLKGSYNAALHHGSGVMSSGIGSHNVVKAYPGSGNITVGYGSISEVQNAGSNLIGDAIGSYGFVSNTGTGTTTRAYSMYADSPFASAGSIGTAYGLYINSITAGVTDNYAIYSGGGKSYFAGNVGIGTSSPWAKLTIQNTYGSQAPLFDVASSTNSSGSATTSLFRILANGTLGMGSTTNASIFINGGGTTTDPLGAFRNIALGSESMSYYTPAATDNIAFGYRALYGSSSVPMTGTDNFAAGYAALIMNTTGTNNNAIGNGALARNTTGGNNNALGVSALYLNTTGSNNNASGYLALFSNTTGAGNNALGAAPLYLNTTGSNNNAFGSNALETNSSGSFNNAIGITTLDQNTTGSYNNAIGGGNTFDSALANNTTGSYNNAIGVRSLRYNTAGSYNSAMGYQALTAITTGYDNLMLGHTQNTGGNNITTGYNNITFGYNAGIGTSTNSTNFLNIGNSFFGSMIATTSATSLPTTFANAAFAIATSSLLGNTTFAVQNSSAGNTVANFFSNAGSSLLNINNNGNVGIGTTSPYAKLSVVGQVVADSYNATSSTGYQLNGVTIATASTTLNNYFFASAAQNGGATAGLIYNIAMGPGAMQYATSGTSNFAVGSGALQGVAGNGNTGSNNTAIGWYTLNHNSGTDNNALGSSALSANTTGISNNALGYWALTGNTTGSNNNALGFQALVQNTSGSYNTALGNWALFSNQTGSSLNAIGWNALQNTTGASSTALGSWAGQTNTTGNNNLYLGDEADALAGTYSNSAAIGSHAKVGASNTIVLGGTGAWAANVGIGSSSPTYTLSVEGTSSLGNQAIAGYFTSTSTATSTFVGGLTAPRLALGGLYAFASSYSLAVGGSAYVPVTSSGNGSIAFGGVYGLVSGNGGSIVSSGIGSLAGGAAGQNLGSNITASGKGAIALGYVADGSNTTASGAGSVAIGSGLSSTNSYSMSFGTGFTNSSASTFMVGFSATPTLTVNSSSVGIGTSTPWAKLSIQDSYGSQAPLFDVATSTNASGSATSSLFTILANGNVGIGTSSPAAQLDIVGVNTDSIVGPELITNVADRDFSSDTGNWTGTNWAVGSGVVTHTAGNSTAVILSNAALSTAPSAGKIYMLTFTLNATAADSFTPSVGGVTGTDIGFNLGALTNQVQIIRATGSGALKFTPVYGVWAGTIDNVSLKEITASAATQILRNSDGTAGMELRSGGTGLSNIMLGLGAGSVNTVGLDNAFVGYLAGYANTSANANTFMGRSAGQNTSTGGANSFVGSYAGRMNTTGTYNSFFGYAAGRENKTGNYNVGIGDWAGAYNYAGSANTIVGFNAAGNSGNSYSNNTILGYNGGANINTASNNILLGYQAGDTLTTGSNNIILGYDIDATSSTMTRGLNIGNLIFGTGLDGTGTTLSSGNIGIGTTSPYAKLSVVGEIVGAFFTGTTTATSTFGGNLAINGTGTTTSNGGFNIANGCFAVNGVCVGGGAGATAVGGTGAIQFANGIAFNGDNTQLTFLGNKLALGTSTPWAKLSIQDTYGSQTPLFDVASSTNASGSATTSLFRILANGTLGMGSTTNANIFINGGGTTTNPLSLTALRNVAIGNEAFSYYTSGANDNIALGYQALYGSSTVKMTGFNNTAIGSYALSSNTTGYNNSANGFAALRFNTTGYWNTANGYAALRDNTTGANNTANGYDALLSNTTGSQNTGNSSQSLFYNTTGSFNTANGFQALFSNTTGSGNTALGSYALRANLTGSYNAVLGYNALPNNTTGYDNLMFGHVENTGGNNITTGYNNIMLGYNAGLGTTTDSRNFLNIGNSFFGSMIATTSATSLPTSFTNAAFAIATSSLLGNTTFAVQNSSVAKTVANFFSNAGASLLNIQNSGNVGIGTTTPYATLSVTPALGATPFAIASSSQSAGNMFAINANGSATFGTTTDSSIFINGGGTTTPTFSSVRNIAIGNQSLSYYTTTATDNIAMGYQALYGSSTVLMTGTDNFAAGYRALYSNTTGSRNTALSGGALVSNTTGFGNTALGPWTLNSNTTGSYNASLGYQALYNNTTGYDNFMLGHIANIGGNNITTGYNNIGLGYNAGIGTSTNSTNFLNIGNSFFGSMIATTSATSLPTTFANAAFAVATSSLLGNTTFAVQNSSAGNTVANFFSNAGASLFNINNNGNVGIGTTSPSSKLAVVGEVLASFFTATTTATSTFAGPLAIGSSTQSSSAKLTIDGTMSANGSSNAIAGIHEIYTFNPTLGGTQVGDRLVIQNQPTTATNTAIGQIVRVVDNSNLSNLVRAMEITAVRRKQYLRCQHRYPHHGTHLRYSGRSRTGLAGGSSTPAALYGESSGTTVGDILRLVHGDHDDCYVSRPVVPNELRLLGYGTPHELRQRGRLLLRKLRRLPGEWCLQIQDYRRRHNYHRSSGTNDHPSRTPDWVRRTLCRQ